MRRERTIELAEYGRVKVKLEVWGGLVDACHFISGGSTGCGSSSVLMTAAQAREVALAYLAAAEELEAEDRMKSAVERKDGEG